MDKENRVMVCTICGSDQVEIVKRPIALNVPFGAGAHYEKTICSCKTCGEEIDVTDESERIKAIAVAEKNSLESIIEFIVNQGFSLANIERSLDLPQRTISRWKSGQEPSAAGLTLLRLVRLYPWLLEVASGNYNELLAKTILINNAVDEFVKLKEYLSPSAQGNSALMMMRMQTVGENVNSFAMISGNYYPETSNVESNKTELEYYAN